jgi:hypothetical protein
MKMFAFINVSTAKILNDSIAKPGKHTEDEWF